MKQEPEYKPNVVEEPLQGFIHLSEDEKLLLEIKKTPLEKLQSFTKMLRRNAALKKSGLK